MTDPHQKGTLYYFKEAPSLSVCGCLYATEMKNIYLHKHCFKNCHVALTEYIPLY